MGEAILHSNIGGAVQEVMRVTYLIVFILHNRPAQIFLVKMHKLHRRLWAKRRLPFLRISINQDNPSKLEKREANLKLTQLLRGIVGIALMESFSREAQKPLVTDFNIHHLM